MPKKKNFVLRLDQMTYDALEKWAADEFRSVNGQMEYILNHALKEQFGKNSLEQPPKPSVSMNPKDSSEDSGEIPLK